MHSIDAPVVRSVRDLRVKIYADGADLTEMLASARDPLIRGFTTNPTLMRKAGVTDYAKFARDVVQAIPNHPISFVVCSDEFDEIERQAHRLAALGPNVFVKIPITSTRRQSSIPLLRRLRQAGIQVNSTALLTLEQVRAAAEALAGGPPSYISVFAGRIADTGRDPVMMMQSALEIMKQDPNLELIWASPREVFNLVQAHQIGCHIITVTSEFLKKATLLGKDLDEFSQETVAAFQADIEAAGYSI